MPSLRADPRVVVRERTNLRDLTLDHLDGAPVDLVVADVSFISLTLLVAPLAAVTRAGGALLLMVKPQFEVGRERLGRGGVVRDPGLHREAVDAVLAAAARRRLARPGPCAPAGCRARRGTGSSSCCWATRPPPSRSTSPPPWADAVAGPGCRSPHLCCRG